MRGAESHERRLRLICTPSGYSSAVVNWGNETVTAGGIERKNDAGETWATAHSVDVRFDEDEADPETWWLRSAGNFSRVRQAYYRGAHPGFIQELRHADTLTVWANAESDTLKLEFDVRNLDYALSQQPEHCREPDAYGKWVLHEWETDSGKKSYTFYLYAEGSDDIYVSVYCRGDEPNDRSVQFDWGERRPEVSDDAFKIKRSDGSIHSVSHTVRVRYGDGVTQSESWQLSSSGSRNTSFTQAYIGDGRGWISKLTRVNSLTVDTDAETGESIRAEFDVRRLDNALARMDRQCR